MSWRVPKTNPSDPPIRKILFQSAVLMRAYLDDIGLSPRSTEQPTDLAAKKIADDLVALGDEEVDAEHLDGNHWLVLAKPGKVWRYRAHVVLCKGRIVQEIVGKPH